MIGHDYTPDEVLKRVHRFWDLSGPFPVPRVRVCCPVCGFADVMIKQCKFFVKRPSMKYRCDVMFKCTVCSAVWAHGLVVPKEMAQARLGGGAQVITHTEGKTYFWRDMRKIVDKQG